MIFALAGNQNCGKTTLFNSISGVHSLTSGNVIFEGRDITKMKPYDICHLGMGRTFQIPLSLNEMTVLENVLVASLGRRKMAKARETAEAVIEECGLKDFIARAQYLVEQYGERFEPPALLLEKAAKGELF